jgi:hypothetical protein
VNELGRDHVLKKLVGNLCGRNDSPHREIVLAVVENITNQKGLACILLADNHHHRTFARINIAPVLDHVDIEFP